MGIRFDMKGSSWWQMVGVLLIAALFRAWHVGYGESQICLVPPEEQWLYQAQQVTSVYAWQMSVNGTLPLLSADTFQEYPPMIAPFNSVAMWFFARVMGIWGGVLTVALIGALARRTRANWGVLAMGLVAVAWWVVWSDRLIARFDVAPLLITLAVYLWHSPKPTPRTGQSWGYSGVVVLLMGFAAPLWWVTAGLLIVANWRKVAFWVAIGVLFLPAWRVPLAWYEASQTWDISASATLFVFIVAIALVFKARLSRYEQRLLGVGVTILGVLSGVGVLTQVHLTEQDWLLVHEAQSHIHDGAIVEFDRSLAFLAPVIACPMGEAVRFSLVSTPQESPDYRITEMLTDEELHTVTLSEGRYLVRTWRTPHPMNQVFGEFVRLLGYDVMTPTVAESGQVDIRLDWQLTEHFSVDALAYGAFIHITQPNNPAEKVHQLGWELVAEFGNLGKRAHNYNQRVRFTLPDGVPNGTYDVILGVWHNVEGRGLGSLTLGQITVTGR